MRVGENMKDNYNLIVNFNDINTRKASAIQKYDELYQMVKTYQKMLDDTKECYDTPSGNHFRLVASRYIEIVLLYLENSFKPYIDKLDTITKAYNDGFYAPTSTNIENGDNNEV